MRIDQHTALIHATRAHIHAAAGTRRAVRTKRAKRLGELGLLARLRVHRLRGADREHRSDRRDRGREQDEQKRDPRSARGSPEADAARDRQAQRPPRSVAGSQVFDPHPPRERSSCAGSRRRRATDWPISAIASRLGPSTKHTVASRVARWTRRMGTVTSAPVHPEPRDPRVSTRPPDRAVTDTRGPTTASSPKRTAVVSRGSASLVWHAPERPWRDATLVLIAARLVPTMRTGDPERTSATATARSASSTASAVLTLIANAAESYVSRWAGVFQPATARSIKGPTTVGACARTRARVSLSGQAQAIGSDMPTGFALAAGVGAAGATVPSGDDAMSGSTGTT